MQRYYNNSLNGKQFENILNTLSKQYHVATNVKLQSDYKILFILNIFQFTKFTYQIIVIRISNYYTIKYEEKD